MRGIDFPRIEETVEIAIRRASIFMGFGINAVSDPAFKNYDLSKVTKLRVAPAEVDAETLSTYKSEFSSWIVAGGLRELHEGFTHFLEQINFACLTLGWSVGKFAPQECENFHKSLHGDGFPDKFETLKKRFGIETEHEVGMVSINAARNCLTHRRGVVGRDDTKGNEHLRLSWKSIDIYLIPAGAEPVLTDDIGPEGHPTPPGSQIEFRAVDRELMFPLGGSITFTPKQLADLCYVASQAAHQLTLAAASYAESLGIEGRHADDPRNRAN
jgi:hypothetical protein